MEINCRYKKQNMFYIHSDSTLHRCCYIPGDLYKSTTQMTIDSKLLAKEFELEKTHNLLKMPPGAIVDLVKTSEFFIELEKMWLEEKPPAICVKTCAFNTGGAELSE